MFEPHYKLKIATPDPRLNDAVWEIDGGENTPNCVWGKYTEEYRFSYCRATLRNLNITDGWSSKARAVWELVCCDRDRVFREIAPSNWVHTDLLKIPASSVVVLRSDSPGIKDVLLIEKQFLEPVTPNFRANKFGIPIKPCRKETHRGDILNPNSTVTYGWCAIHQQGIPSGKNNCDHQIPNEYLPCDVEHDQAGPYCNVHGGHDCEYSYCRRYAGPLVDNKEDSFPDKEIPTSYETCDYWRGQICGKHEGTKLEGRDYCEKYDGPLLFIDPT